MMATQTLQLEDVPSPMLTKGMSALGGLVSLYGAMVLIDALAAAIGFGAVPFGVGPPMPHNWFPNLLVGLSITGAGGIAVAGVRQHLSWAAVLGLFLALGAVYEIVLLDRVYVHQGRPALSGSKSGANPLQDRLDRLYSGTLRVQVPQR
jgi:hypothetical protein